jgi:hypothetical protein
MCCYVGLGLHVHILCAVKAGRTARAHTIGAKCLDGLFFESLVGDKVVKVIGREVGDGAAIGELGLGSGWSVPVLAWAHIRLLLECRGSHTRQ